MSEEQDVQEFEDTSQSQEQEAQESEERPRPQCPRPSPPQQPVIKRQRSGSAPPQHNRPRRNVRKPVQLQYTRDFKQQLTHERVEVPAIGPITPVKKRHSKEKKDGWGKRGGGRKKEG